MDQLFALVVTVPLLVAAALLAGVVATHIATVFGFMEIGIGLPRLRSEERRVGKECSS